MSDPEPISTASEELEHKIAVNMGLYYRESDKKWLREKFDNGKYVGVDDMTAEVNTILALFEAQRTRIELEATRDFIRKETIIEKFETLAEYIPSKFQRGYIEGMREEVDDFIVQLTALDGREEKK